MMGWEACKKSIVVPRYFIEEKDAFVCPSCGEDYEESQKEDLSNY